MSINKDFFLDTLKYLPVKIMPALSGILTVFFLTKKNLVDVSSFVDYTFIIAATLICSQIIVGWVNSSVIFYYTGFKEDNEKEKFTITISTLQLLFFCVGALVLFLVLFFALHSFLIALITIFSLFFQTFLTFNYSFYQAKREINFQIKATFIQAVLQILGLLICYFFFKNSLVYFLFFLAFSYLITSMFLIFSNKNMMKVVFSNKFDFQSGLKILSYGLPVCLWFFATQIYQIGDRIFFKYFDITEQVGNYVAFRDLAVGLSGFVAMPLMFASHPIIIQLSKDENNKNTIEKLLRRNILILSAFFFITILIIYFFGEFLVEYIVGSKYLLTPKLMVIILITILLGVISIYLQKGIEAKGNTILMLKVSAIVGLVSVILNFFFIKKFGVTSAIYISLFSHLMYCIFVYYYSRKVFKIFI